MGPLVLLLVRLQLACAPGAVATPPGGALSEASISWRPAAVADLPSGDDPSPGRGRSLGVSVDLDGDGRPEQVRVEVDAAGVQARVVVVGGPVLGLLPPTPQGPVSSGLWAHPPGAATLSDRAPAELITFSRSHALVEWCLPPPGQPWSAASACYGSAFVGLEGGALRTWEVWD